MDITEMERHYTTEPNKNRVICDPCNKGPQRVQVDDQWKPVTPPHDGYVLPRFVGRADRHLGAVEV